MQLLEFHGANQTQIEQMFVQVVVPLYPRLENLRHQIVLRLEMIASFSPSFVTAVTDNEPLAVFVWTQEAFRRRFALKVALAVLAPLVWVYESL